MVNIAYNFKDCNAMQSLHVNWFPPICFDCQCIYENEVIYILYYISNIDLDMLKWCRLNMVGIKIKVEQFSKYVYNFHFSDNHHKQAPANRNIENCSNAPMICVACFNNFDPKGVTFCLSWVFFKLKMLQTYKTLLFL